MVITVSRVSAHASIRDLLLLIFNGMVVGLYSFARGEGEQQRIPKLSV